MIDFSRGKFKMVTAGVVTTPAHTPIDERLEDIFDSLTEIITETNPDVMSIEKLFLRAMLRRRFLWRRLVVWRC